MESRIRIQADGLSLELQGDPDHVERAYEAVRPVLLARLREIVGPAGTVDEAQPIRVPDGEGRKHLRVAITHDLYRRMHAVERTSAAGMPLFRPVDPARLKEVFIERVARDAATRAADLGRPLWSEVAGRSSST